ncbi:MAG: Omp28-related outer membrane protein [Salibacteraceae bacterium]
MKQIYLIIAIVFIGVTGCNIVEEPYGPIIDYGWDSAYDQDPVYNDTNAVPRRRILLEELTGHKCPNCPDGQDIAKDLLTDNPDDFVVVSIHNSGYFSKPDLTDPSHPYPGDFETETGEKLRIGYQFQVFPGGMLNRTEIDGSPKVDYKLWETTVNDLLSNPSYMAPRFKFNLVTTFNNELGNKTVRVQYKVESLGDIPGNIAIVGYVVESKIISPQTDNREPNPYVADYEHNHMLRVGFPGDGSGKTIFTNPKPGDIAEVTNPSDFLITGIDDAWVPENMEVIVFVYNSNTGEILGTEEMHMVN